MSPAAGGRRITIRSISCRGVRAFVPFQKPPLYAAVSLGGRREKTPADPDGGENPDWDGAVVAFDLDGDGQQQPEEQLVLFQVKAQVPLLGNKLVGTAGVPVADLAAGGAGCGDGAAPRHVSYQVSAPDGKPNGTLSFAYAVSGGAGGVGPQPQLYPAPDGARPEQAPTFCCGPPPPPQNAAYPTPATANIAPYGGGYPPPASASLYPPLQDLLPPSSYPPPQRPPPPHPVMTNPPFPAPSSGSYPPPPVTAYPPPPASSTAYPPQYITSYPPPPTNYPPPPASNLDPPPTSTYPPPPPDSGSAYPVLPRSAPSPAPSTVDRALPYYPAPPSQDAASTSPAPPGGSYYPPPGSRHPELDGAGRTPYYYPPPGTRYP